MRPLYYDKQGKPLAPMEWVRLWEDWSYRCIADDQVGAVRVATIWEGIDHDLYGDPHLFETTVFDGPLATESRRYKTLAEALVGHAMLLARVRAAGKARS